MAKYIAAAPENGFTVDEVTQGQIYPASEVEQCIRNPGADDEDPGITEEQAIKTVAETVDTADVVRKGDGGGIVYVYGYRCCGDRLKVDPPRRTRCSGLLRRSPPARRINRFSWLRSRATSAARLRERFRRLWRRGGGRLWGAAPNGLELPGTRFWQFINSSYRAAEFRARRTRQHQTENPGWGSRGFIREAIDLGGTSIVIKPTRAARRPFLGVTGKIAGKIDQRGVNPGNACWSGMHSPNYYRDQAGHARRLADLMHQPDMTEMLDRMAQDFEDIACDLETGAVDVRHPELLPQRGRDR
jgi:hypothetical protein